MRNKVIVFANTKGGVGKSTLATHLAVHVFDQGHSVALLDVDEQHSSSKWVLQAEPGITVRTAETPEAVAAELKDLRRSHEFVIADAPGKLGDETRTLMLLSELAIFPMGPSILDLRATITATETLQYARTITNVAVDGLLVLNKTRVRDTISRELKEAAGELGFVVAATQIRDLRAFREAAQQGTVVTRMGDGAREAAEDIIQLFAQILNQEKAVNEMQSQGKVANG